MLTKVTRASLFRTSHRSEGVCCCLLVMKWCRWFKSLSTLSNGSVDTLVLHLSVAILFEHSRMNWWMCTDKCSHSCAPPSRFGRLEGCLLCSCDHVQLIRIATCALLSFLSGTLNHSMRIRSRHSNCEEYTTTSSFKLQFQIITSCLEQP